MCNGLHNCASRVKIKVRLSLCPTWRIIVGLEMQLQSFLTTGVGGGECSVSSSGHFSTPPTITSECHISQLQRFLVTIFYIENYFISRLIHCLLLGINWETECIYVSLGRKIGRYFLQVQLLRLGHNDTQLNRCCLLFQLRNGIDAVPEALYMCLFKRWWMN